MKRSIRVAALACVSGLLFTACGHRAQVTPPASAGAAAAPASNRRVVDAHTVYEGGRLLHGMLARDRSGSHPVQGARRKQTISNLNYYGGYIHEIPQVALVFWGFTGSSADPNGEQTYLTNFVKGMGGTWWTATLTQYSDSSSNIVSPANYLVGTWTDTTNAVPSSPTSSDIAAEASRAVTALGLTTPQLVNVIVATPSGHSTSDFAANGGSICAWHSTTTTAGGASFPFTNFPYQSDAGTSCGQNSVNSGSAGTLDGVSIVAGHEIAETITDPSPYSGWVDTSNQEIGDKCAWVSLANLSTTQGTFAVQPLWSNAISGCSQSYASLAPTKTCTNDAYGYCLQIALSSTHGAYCSTGVHSSVNTAKQYLWNNGVYAGQYTRDHWVNPSVCADPDVWDPTDPATQNSDPLLP